MTLMKPYIFWRRKTNSFRMS